jgi:hypothetical protein
MLEAWVFKIARESVACDVHQHAALLAPRSLAARRSLAPS